MRTVIGSARLPYGEIQGLILRGYTHPQARHFAVNFPDAAAGREFVAAIAPAVQTAVDWGDRKPPVCINIGFTADGLKALGVQVALTTNFPAEFVAGAIGRAANVGDTGDSAPAKWELSLGTGNVHAIVSTWALDDASREAATVQVNAWLAESGATSFGSHDADDLPNSFVHFNYRDSISQPNIDGAPMKNFGLDSQPIVATGEFVTGYPNQSGTVMPVPLSDAFGKNGSYAAFRILEQDVVAFFAYVDAQAAALGVDPELIKSNFCGRMTDGTPLATTTGAPGDLNDFDYSDDPNGKKCPYDSHIRRSHPRNSFGFGPAPGGEGYRHRILRRALPYGPVFDPQNPVTASRGLIGHFLGASLGQQFEFVMSQWVNGLTVANNLSDALIGINEPAGKLRMANGTTVKGFTRFTQTVGSAYVFFPSMTGLMYLGGGC
ncbi:MAG TPA: hypothetical protein VF698_19380 [Thermoanaerobaculia bacterium]